MLSTKQDNNVTVKTLIKKKNKFKKDDLLLSLKILGEIQKGNRLFSNNITDKTIEIDNTHWTYQWYVRWVNGETRELSIEKIENIINKTFEYIDSTVDLTNDQNKNSYFDESKGIIINKFIVELNKASQGILNLKTIYEEDIKTLSIIDIIIEKIKQRVSKMEQILQIST